MRCWIRIKGMLAYAFPGQGSQYSGMGKVLVEAYPEAERVFEEAEEITGMDLKGLLMEATDEELKDTRNTQPAIFLHSVALYEVLKKRRPPDVVFGHSLGEFSALYAAGVFDFGTALNLVVQRGRIMAETGGGSMLAVIGEGALDVSESLLRSHGFKTLVIANYNSPKQVVLSGSREEVEEAMRLLREDAGRRLRLVPLKVSAAFHSPLMERASMEFAEVLEGVEFGDPTIPIIMNSTGRVARTRHEVKSALLKQLRSSVRFVSMVQEAVGMGVDEVWEVGPGKVLCGLIRQCTNTITCSAMDPRFSRTP